MASIDYKTAAEHWRYDPESGHIFWIVKRTRVPASMIAGSVNNERRIIIGLRGKRYYAHRIAWVLMTRAEPPEIIDHINGNPSDNRWSNLRAATETNNQGNRRVAPRGVTIRPYNRFEASIRIEGKKRHLGCFATVDDAHAAYVAAHRVVHGEFSSFARTA